MYYSNTSQKHIVARKIIVQTMVICIHFHTSFSLPSKQLYFEQILIRTIRMKNPVDTISYRLKYVLYFTISRYDSEHNIEDTSNTTKSSFSVFIMLVGYKIFWLINSYLSIFSLLCFVLINKLIKMSNNKKILGSENQISSSTKIKFIFILLIFLEVCVNYQNIILYWIQTIAIWWVRHTFLYQNLSE